MHDTPEILKEILEYKRKEVAQQQQKHKVEDLKAWADEQGATRGFLSTIAGRIAQKEMAVIAEIKRASPSQGVLCDAFDPLAIARSYMMSGATCLSVLTDQKYFKGSGTILDLVRRHCPLPALRKDFIIDEYQVYESRAYGADCILLIAAAVQGQQLYDLFALATEQGMDVLLEVHNQAELEIVLEIEEAQLIGINNRNLHTFEVDMDLTFQLAPHIPNEKIIVSESGITQAQDIERLKASQIYACLVGGALMSSEDPGAALQALLQ